MSRMDDFRAAFAAELAEHPVVKCVHCGEELHPHPHPQAGGELICDASGSVCDARFPIGGHEPSDSGSTS